MILSGSMDIINNRPNIPLNKVVIFPFLIPKQSIERGSKSLDRISFSILPAGSMISLGKPPDRILSLTERIP